MIFSLHSTQSVDIVLYVSNEMRDAYKRFLQQRGISPNEQFALQKWMRFFLDYCDKYNHKAKSRLSIPPFLQKLTSKKQKALQIRQAEKAIQLFLQCIQ